eukprot:scaffold3183_cov381-Prasinococcus_capsulatus_cf.AAC.22
MLLQDVPQVGVRESRAVAPQLNQCAAHRPVRPRGVAGRLGSGGAPDARARRAGHSRRGGRCPPPKSRGSRSPGR